MAADRVLTLPSTARVTPQRRAVVDAVASRGGSFTAIEIFDAARRSEPGLGLATVYRTLELLLATGSVRPLAGRGRFAYVRCAPGHHHHLVCLSCGSVEETDLCAAPPKAELQRRHGFAAEEHQFEVFGTCAECAA